MGAAAGASMSQEEIAIAMASRALRGGSAVQAQFAFVFSVATQARNILRDTCGVVKIVALVAIAAGTVHGGGFE